MAEPDARLRRLADRTRDLLEYLDRTRQVVLAPGDLNRTLRQILRNQVAILSALDGAPSDTPARPAPAAAWPTAPLISVQPKPASDDLPELLPEEEGGDGPELTLGTDELASLVGELNRRKETHTNTNGRAHSPKVHTATTTEGSEADALTETRVVPPSQAKAFVERFDNQDRDYEKGLAKLNRWTAAGMGGTPFQMRDDWAYLNLKGASPSGVRNYEEQLMKRMGFSRRVGRLELPGLVGEIVVYERT